MGCFADDGREIPGGWDANGTLWFNTSDDDGDILDLKGNKMEIGVDDPAPDEGV